MLRSITLALTIAFSLQAVAAPASQASVEKALDLMHVERSISAIWGPLEANMRQTIAASRGATPPTPQQQADENRVIARAIEVMHQEMSWDKIKPKYVKLYIDTFSQEEVDGLIKFYASPAGQAYIAKMPLLMQHSMQLMQVQMQDLMPKLTAVLGEATKHDAASGASK